MDGEGSTQHPDDASPLSGSPVEQGFFSRLGDSIKSHMFGEAEARRRAEEWASEETHTEETGKHRRVSSAGEAGTKAAPAPIGVGAAGALVKQGNDEVFKYHDDLATGGRERTLSQHDTSEEALLGQEKPGALTQTLLANTFFMAKGRSLQEMYELKGKSGQYSSVEAWRSNVVRVLQGEDVRVPTLDGRSLDGIWGPQHKHLAKGQGLKVAVIFHPNFACALDMVQYGHWYRSKGFGVLMVTMGGYAGSDGDTTELSTYLDAHAAVQYVLNVRHCALSRVLCHGVSIGGALASAAACLHPGVHCTVDQTFVNAKAVAEELIQGLPGWQRHTPKWVIGSFISAVFPEGEADPRLPGITTDAYDNEVKAARVQGHYFVLWSDQDHMMPPSFAERLARGHLVGLLEQITSSVDRFSKQHAEASEVGDEEACKSAYATDVVMLRRWLFKLGWLTAEDEALGREELCLKLASICHKYDDSLVETAMARCMACIRGGGHGSFFAEDPCCEALYLKFLDNIGLSIGSTNQR